MRIAVLGTGLMAQVRTRQLLADPRVQHVALGSKDGSRAAQAARELGASDAGSIEEVLAGPVDAVMIAGASSDRSVHLAGALRAGRPIFCEKPLATDLEECRRVVDEAAAAGVEIQVGFQRRYDREYAAAKELIDSGGLGRLYSINLTSHDRVSPPESFIETSGGLFSDLGVHDYDLARWLTGDEVSEVYSVGACRTEWDYFERFGDADTAVTVLRMHSGVPVVVSCSRHSPDGHDVRAEIFGSRHNVTVGHGSTAPLRSPEELAAGREISAFPNFFARFEPAFAEQTRAFVDWIGGAGTNPCPASDGVESLRIAVAARRSWVEKRPVSLQDI